MTMPKKIEVISKTSYGRTNWIVDKPSLVLVKLLYMLFDYHQHEVNHHGLYLQSNNTHDIRVEFMALKPNQLYDATKFLEAFINRPKNIKEARRQAYGY